MLRHLQVGGLYSLSSPQGIMQNTTGSKRLQPGPSSWLSVAGDTLDSEYDVRRDVTRPTLK